MSVHRTVLLSVLALLAACGQKGALYLPDKNTKVITTPAPPPPPAPAASPPQQGSAPQPGPGEKPSDQSDDQEPPK